MTERFQNINLDKDVTSFHSAANMKNELQIITLPDKVFAYWDKFLQKHADGKLIGLVRKAPFKVLKNYKAKDNRLAREFFRRCGWITDKDFTIMPIHLLGKTPR